MSEPYSPLRYPGGKSKITSFLAEVMACNGIEEPHYIEPYAGGAGAALALLMEEYVKSIVINDADPRISSFWRAIKLRNEDFLEMLSKAPVTISEWHKQRDIYTRCDTRSYLKLGFSTFFLNRTTRSGIIHNGGPIGGLDQTGNYKIDARFNKEGLRKRIEKIGAYADRIEVSGDDGLDLLKKIHMSRKAAAHSFVYLDPPYYMKGAELYLNRFTHDQHKKLAQYLSVRRTFPWVMTYDNVEAIRMLYAEFPQSSFDLSYSAYERRLGEELLIHPSHIIVSSSAMRSLPLAA